ncbi:unnamed protein product, partial [Rotaria magnacalcarata]
IDPNPISSHLNEHVLPSRTEPIAKPTKEPNKSSIVSENKISLAVDEYSFLTSNTRPSSKPYSTNSFDSSTTSNRTQYGGRLASSKTKIILLLVIFLGACAAIILPPVLTMVIFEKKKTSGTSRADLKASPCSNIATCIGSETQYPITSGAVLYPFDGNTRDAFLLPRYNCGA